jgi:hypothetical protein
MRNWVIRELRVRLRRKVRQFKSLRKEPLIGANQREPLISANQTLVFDFKSIERKRGESPFPRRHTANVPAAG